MTQNVAQCRKISSINVKRRKLSSPSCSPLLSFISHISETWEPPLTLKKHKTLGGSPLSEQLSEFPVHSQSNPRIAVTTYPTREPNSRSNSRAAPGIGGKAPQNVVQSLCFITNNSHKQLLPKKRPPAGGA